MTTAVHALCVLLGCDADELCAMLTQEDEARTKAIDFLRSSTLRTNYKDRRTRRRGNHRVRITDLTPLGADEMYAYEGILEIRVRQHFFSKYKLKVDYPLLPCGEQRFRSGHAKFFPLEMLVVDERRRRRREANDGGQPGVQAQRVCRTS
ncbi:hypothetical protein AAVH_22730 [Aphelenchoides avenae]|nr:hypothetical protein AAVH_22730 [Aphelenchus avenae]